MSTGRSARSEGNGSGQDEIRYFGGVLDLEPWSAPGAFSEHFCARQPGGGNPDLGCFWQHGAE